MSNGWGLFALIAAAFIHNALDLFAGIVTQDFDFFKQLINS